MCSIQARTARRELRGLKGTDKLHRGTLPEEWSTLLIAHIWLLYCSFVVEKMYQWCKCFPCLLRPFRFSRSLAWKNPFQKEGHFHAMIFCYKGRVVAEAEIYITDIISKMKFLQWSSRNSKYFQIIWFGSSGRRIVHNACNGYHANSRFSQTRVVGASPSVNVFRTVSLKMVLWTSNSVTGNIHY